MNKLSSINCFTRNINSLGITYREAFIILAVLELQEAYGYCTCVEVARLMGEPKVQTTMKRMQWAFNVKELRNDRGNISYHYKLSEAGMKSCAKLLAFFPVNIKEFKNEPNGTRKKKKIA